MRAALMLYQARQFENLRGGRSHGDQSLDDGLGTQDIIESLDEDFIISQITTQQLSGNNIVNSGIDVASQIGSQLSSEDTNELPREIAQDGGRRRSTRVRMSGRLIEDSAG